MDAKTYKSVAMLADSKTHELLVMLANAASDRGDKATYAACAIFTGSPVSVDDVIALVGLDEIARIAADRVSAVLRVALEEA